MKYLLLAIVIISIIVGGVFFFKDDPAVTITFEDSNFNAPPPIPEPLDMVEPAPQEVLPIIEVGINGEIPVYGVKLVMTEDMLDLIYTYKEKYDIVTFSTKQMVQVGGEFCDAQNAPLGVMSKITKAEIGADGWGYYNSIEDVRASTIEEEGHIALAKEFDDYFIVFTMPHDSCVSYENEEARNLQRDLLHVVRKAVVNATEL